MSEKKPVHTKKAHKMAAAKKLGKVKPLTITASPVIQGLKVETTTVPTTLPTSPSPTTFTSTSTTNVSTSTSATDDWINPE
jgi:hypothetical protein